MVDSTKGRGKEAQQEEELCRICLQGARQRDAFLAPCNCNGSQRLVHTSCLRQWQKTVVGETNSKRAYKCGICGARFTCGFLVDENECLFPCWRPCLGSRHLGLVGTAPAAVLVLLTMAATVFRSSPAGEVPGLGAGTMLVATHHIRSGIFKQSVVLLVQHSKWGAHGYIVNQPSRSKGRAAQRMHGDNDLMVAACDEGVGGPVSHLPAVLFATNTTDHTNASKIIDGVWELHQHTDHEAFGPGMLGATQCLRLQGYSGWSSRQLEGEIAEELGDLLQRHMIWCLAGTVNSCGPNCRK
eukprot:CAMPEP_0172668258 /NCGR_PEP_ID=MMETSP1074-20121228/8951_1 /TAXON_ID=2916 /ORGANISM="Ceratium fusus, Strain PA161109" /LENGTH=297 /DNA_ID=CAMNT_0013484889 /DNA_START=38 /DNA_END=932 /DNA_ORIENTATION=-